MKTLEDKARIAREKVIDDLKRAYEKHKDIQHYATASACIEMYGVGLYMSGAKEALSSQWRKPEDELPKDGDTILIYYKYRDSGRLEYKYSYMQVKYNIKNGFNLFENNMSKWGGKVLFWMPIPGLPDNKED